MNDATTDALQQMARHVAEQLVADALKHMVGPTMTVTLHPQTVVGQGIVQAPRLLEPGTSPSSSSLKARRGRKPGRKLKAKKPAGPSSSGRTRVSKTRNAGSSPAGPAIDASGKRCRKCMRLGTAVVVKGKHVKCSHCKHEWDLRAPRAGAAAAEPHVDRCTRCDHTEAEHDAQTGKCLSVRCVCAGFWK